MAIKCFFQFEIIIYVHLSASFEYLCYVSTAIEMFCDTLSAGIVFRREDSDVHRRQTLTSKDCAT